MNRPRRGRCWTVLVVAVVTVSAAFAGARRLEALFWSSATAQMNVSVAIPAIPTPTDISCATTGLPVVARWAHLEWDAPSGAPQPTQYAIVILDGGAIVELGRVAGNVEVFDVTTGLLVGALQYILNLLLNSSTTYPLSVTAVYGSARSTPVWTHRLIGVLGVVSGVGCATGSGLPGALVAGRLSADTTAAPPTSTEAASAVTTVAETTPTVPTATSATTATTGPAPTTIAPPAATPSAPTTASSTTTVEPATTAATTSTTTASPSTTTTAVDVTVVDDVNAGGVRRRGG